MSKKALLKNKILYNIAFVLILHSIQYLLDILEQ